MRKLTQAEISILPSVKFPVQFVNGNIRICCPRGNKKLHDAGFYFHMTLVPKLIDNKEVLEEFFLHPFCVKSDAFMGIFEQRDTYQIIRIDDYFPTTEQFKCLVEQYKSELRHKEIKLPE